ncbi:Neutral/alkaline nonlysosomal ceramidase [Glomus cerebriforme]|uniref:Neutral ceramidase n=1 Tax=Glomus cerebriforme TaxID=658196 RepID=A0A397SMZ9_9GLOM|nr:Neutral/alkaline nonlysosomal ceramidase [Glomus cerebriforme]
MLKIWICMLLVITQLNQILVRGQSATNYNVGIGIADITGTVAGVNMMGYAMPEQVAAGLHIRQRSRAFIIVDPSTSKRVVFVSADLAMGSLAVRRATLERLKETFGDLYNEENVAISGTHTHAGPAGYLQYALYQITSFGYIKENTEAISTGIYNSIVKAHNSIQPGSIFVSSGELLGANINRSPFSYEQNPEGERAQYKDNVDKEMILLKFTNAKGDVIGSINWFPVHPVSMMNNNTLVSGDNKGTASYFLEREYNNGTLPGEETIVHAFANSNLGDTSPNIFGPYCADTGLPCEYKTSTCNGKKETCFGRGYGYLTGDDIYATRKIAELHVSKAKELIDTATTPVTGSIDFKFTKVDLENYNFTLNGNDISLCKAALGYSMIAGTTDGPGGFNFVQGDNSTGNPFWKITTGVIKQPTKETIECQRPKPIVLATGEMTSPYDYTPSIVEIQLLRIGNIIICVVPAEFTTMSGRRLTKTVKNVLVKKGIIDENGIVIVSGPSNSYTHYVTTPEEYSVQRYEGGSTIYGPNTLNAYLQLYTDLSVALADNLVVPIGFDAPDFTDKALNFLPPIIVDIPTLFKKFGDVIKDVNEKYIRGETIEVEFVGGHPKNYVQLESSFFYVQRLEGNRWINFKNDGDWNTKFKWLGNSVVRIIWEITDDVQAGTYRILYQGYHKLLGGKIVPESGITSIFTVS